MGRYRLASHRTTRIMKIFVALSTLLAAATCQEAQVLATYAGYHPYAAAGYPYAAAPYAAYAPYSAGSQFHAQDEFGNLNYGYTNINSVKQEVGNAYGGVTGGYSYVDANNQLQRVEYVADGLGFRVADSRLPVAPVYDGVAPTFNPEPLVAPTFNPKAGESSHRPHSSHPQRSSPLRLPRTWLPRTRLRRTRLPWSRLRRTLRCLRWLPWSLLSRNIKI